MENKQCHLKMVQDVITRMNRNSFLLKGWCITLVSAIIALATKPQSDGRLIYVVLLPTIMFWALDGLFLWQEKLFRRLYDKVRITDEGAIDFSMETQVFMSPSETWSNFIFSKTLVLFYAPMFIGAWILIGIVN